MASSNLVRGYGKQISRNHRRIEAEDAGGGDTHRLARAEGQRALITWLIAGPSHAMIRAAFIHARHVGSHGHIARHDIGSSKRYRFDNGRSHPRSRQQCHRQSDHQGHHRSSQAHLPLLSAYQQYWTPGPSRQAAQSGTSYVIYANDDFLSLIWRNVVDDVPFGKLSWIRATAPSHPATEAAAFEIKSSLICRLVERPAGYEPARPARCTITVTPRTAPITPNKSFNPTLAPARAAASVGAYEWLRPGNLRRPYAVTPPGL